MGSAFNGSAHRQILDNNGRENKVGGGGPYRFNRAYHDPGDYPKNTPFAFGENPAKCTDQRRNSRYGQNTARAPLSYRPGQTHMAGAGGQVLVNQMNGRRRKEIGDEIIDQQSHK